NNNSIWKYITSLYNINYKWYTYPQQKLDEFCKQKLYELQNILQKNLQQNPPILNYSLIQQIELWKSRIENNEEITNQDNYKITNINSNLNLLQNKLYQLKRYYNEKENEDESENNEE